MSLLRKLLLWFVMSGTMFFADGASALGVVDGAGGGGEGGEAGAGGGGEGAGEGAGVDDADTGAGEGGDNTERLGGEGEGEGDPNALVDAGDGRKIPAKYKEIFEKNKELRSLYFGAQALRKAFPGGVKEAVELARQVEDLGGLEGIEQVQSELSEYTGDAELFNNGDPKWIENSFQQDPDLSLKHFNNALGYVSEHHPEHYDHLMAKVIVNDLGALPVRQIYDILAGLKDNPQAQQAAKTLAAYYNSRQELAKKAPEKQINPQQKKIDEQNAKLTEREQKVRNQSINAEAGPHLNRTIESTLTAAAKIDGFDLAKLQKEQPNRYGRFLKDVRNAVHAEVLNDSKWLDRYAAALAANDVAKCVRMLNARHDQAIKGTDLKPGVASVILREWFGTPKGGARRPGAGGAGGSGGGSGATRTVTSNGKSETPILVNSLPPAKEINYSDPVTDKWNGIYRLKTGKLIQVKRP